jgi:hypothetical protein
MNKKQKPKGKPGPKRQEFDYDEVAFHCRSQISDARLARKLKMSPQLLAYHLKKDPKLQEARDGGTWDGQNIVGDAMFRKMLDRYMTICKDCHKIRFSFDQFFESCPYCDKTEPVDDETGEDLVGKHTNVRHKFVAGDTNIMLAFGKTYLGLTDRMTHQGDEKNPVAIKDMTDEQIDKRLAKLDAMLLDSEKAMKEKKAHEKKSGPGAEV